MRNYFAAAVVAAALMIPAAASAAVLVKGAGVGCPGGQQVDLRVRFESDHIH